MPDMFAVSLATETLSFILSSTPHKAGISSLEKTRQMEQQSGTDPATNKDQLISDVVLTQLIGNVSLNCGSTQFLLFS